MTINIYVNGGSLTSTTYIPGSNNTEQEAICHACKTPGHYIHECPVRAQRSLAAAKRPVRGGRGPGGCLSFKQHAALYEHGLVAAALGDTVANIENWQQALAAKAVEDAAGAAPAAPALTGAASITTSNPKMIAGAAHADVAPMQIRRVETVGAVQTLGQATAAKVTPRIKQETMDHIPHTSFTQWREISPKIQSETEDEGDTPRAQKRKDVPSDVEQPDCKRARL